MPHLSCRLPIAKFTLALDRVTVERAGLLSIEARLQCDRHSGKGSIIVRDDSTLSRQRSFATQRSDHCLRKRYEPTVAVGFDCTAMDMPYAPEAGRSTGSRSVPFDGVGQRRRQQRAPERKPTGASR